MKRKKRVLLIGTGLIGCSVALAIKKEHDTNIIGFDSKTEHCILAEKLNMIDEYTMNVEEEAVEADLIILACPVEKTVQFLDSLSELKLRENVIVTDVGSTKGQLSRKAELLLEKGITYIGGHPMAGSHKVGPGSAKAHLFENAYYILTPPEETDPAKITELKNWLKGTKANFIVMDADEHDLVTGVVSHFPHLVAASLVRQVESHAKQNEKINWLAAGGFRDITRIASSSPEMWRDIVKQNKTALLSLIDEWMNEMEYVKQMISEDEGSILNYFSGAKQYRDSLPVRAKGAINAFYDLYVDILDRPGVISHVTTLLAQSNISITNIRIIEAREDVYGVLRVSFQTEEDRDSARKNLEENDYETYMSI